jgi:hypothetical protein
MLGLTLAKQRGASPAAFSIFHFPFEIYHSRILTAARDCKSNDK